MFRWFIRGSAVAVVVVAVAMVSAPSASAYTGDAAAARAIIDDSSHWTGTYNLATGTGTFTPTAGEAAVVSKAMRASLLLSRANLAAGALGLGVLIGGGVNKWFHLSCSLAGTCTPSGGTYSVLMEGWVWEAAALSGDKYGYYWAQMDGVPPNSYCCFASGSGDVFQWPQAGTDVYRDAIRAFIATHSAFGGAEVSTGGGWGYSVRVNEAQLPVKVDVPPETYVAQAYGATVTVPADPGTGSATATAIRDALKSGDDDTDVGVAMAIDPAYEGYPPAELTMPDCEGETYASCLALLEALGYVGSITTNELGIDDAVLSLGGGEVVTTNPGAGVGGVLLDDPITFNVNPDPLPLELAAQLVNETAAEYVARLGFVGDPTYIAVSPEFVNPALGPSAPIRVVAPAPATGTRSITVPAPGGDAPAARIPNEVTTEVTFYVNPSDMAPIESGGGPGGCESCPPLDMSPLTDLEWGENFPFGIFTWLGSTWEDMTGDPATCIRAPFGKPEGIGGGTLTVALCSQAWKDTYRAPAFLVLEFVFTVALILGLARRMTGTGGMVDEA